MIAKDRRAIRFRKNRGIHILPDFAFVNVERGDHANIARTIAADLPVHQADSVFRLFVFVIVNALNERTGAIANAHNSNIDWIHCVPS